MKSNYDVLGKHIRLIDNRNTESISNRVLGINIDKYFMPSVANVIGTDLSRYKLIKKGQFACNPMHVGRDERLPISLYTEEEPAIVSPAYFMFEIIDQEILNAEYLMMWFRRPEFDRICWLKTDGSVRGGISWDDICRITVPVPPYERQLEIVKSYKAITDRIELKKKINDNLEEQLSSLYHQLFDNCESVLCTVGDLGEIVAGATPSTDVQDNFCTNGIVWLSPRDLTASGRKFIFKGETDITEAGYKSCSTKLMPKGTVLLTSRAPVGAVAIAVVELCTNQGFKSIVPKTEIGTEFIYYFLKENKALLDSHSSGTTFMEISGSILKKIPAFVPSKKLLDTFKTACVPVFVVQAQNEIEIERLYELQQVLLARLSR